jgi:hypothetical protein
LPKNAKLYFLDSWGSYNGFDFDVWWINLELRSADGKSGHAYRIRERMLNSRPAGNSGAHLEISPVKDK